MFGPFGFMEFDSVSEIRDLSDVIDKDKFIFILTATGYFWSNHSRVSRLCESIIKNNDKIMVFS